MTAPLADGQPTADEQELPAEKSGASAKATPASYGSLIDLAPELAAKKAEKLWKQNPWQAKVLAGISKQNAWWRAGRRFVKLVANQDTDSVRLLTPLGIEAIPPVPNKVEELVQNSKNILLADPPRPDCEPSKDTPQAVDAAQFATRYLMSLAGESGLNTDAVLDAAIDIAATYGSGYSRVVHDPTAAGLRPLSVEAKADAMSAAAPLEGEGPITVKYVMEDGTLSDEAEGAKQVWQPGLRIFNYNSNQVRFLPRTATGIADALGVVIGEFRSLGDLKALYPEVAKMSPDQLWELAAWKTTDHTRIIPEGYEYKTPEREKEDDSNSGPDDETLICTLTVLHRSHPAYPYGCEAVFGGGKYRLFGETLSRKTPTDDGGMQDETLDLPIAQMRWRNAPSSGNPHGESIVQTLGPMDEMRATQYAAALEYLFRFSRPRPYLPMGTIVQPEDWADPDKPIYFNPNGKPEFPPLPDFPQMGLQLVDRIDGEMENAASIQGPAIGQVAGSVRSAEQQKIAIEQANVGLTALRANAQDYYERLHRLLLQMARAHITTPTLMRSQGQDGAYQVEEFLNTDLGSTREVRVQKGTFTLMMPTAKSDMVTAQVQSGMLDPMEGKRLIRDNLSSFLGLTDDPHIRRIKRHLQAWRKGPPEEALAQAQEMQQQAEIQPPVPQIDPMTGQPIPPPDPVAMAAQSVFPLLPVDDEQMVAILRHQELSRAVAELEFYPFPSTWTGALINAYLHAKQAAGIVTVMEQQQMAQQQAMMQQQQAGQEKETDSQRKAEGEQQKHGNKMEQMQMQGQQSQQAADREAATKALQTQGVQ